MPGTISTPAAHATCVFSGVPGQFSAEALTLAGDLSFTPPQIVREEIEDAQSFTPKHKMMFRSGKITLTGLTDKNLEWLPSVDGSQMVATFLNKRVATFLGVTLALSDGLEENTTAGTTNELTFTFTQYSDNNS